MSRVAVVILNWNGEAMLRRFLPSVVEHSPEADIVVADNGSDDGSVGLLRREFPSVRVIELGRNHGFAEGYNQALARVESEFYVLLNSDVRVVAGWLAPLLRHMDERPSTAACQPKLLSEWRPGSFEYAGAAGGFVDALGYPYCRGRVMGSVEEDRGQYDTPLPVLWATGAALLVRSSAYWAAGGLDGRFFAHQEEIDLCWRLRARGWDVYCVPQSAVCHLGGGTLPQGSPRKTFLNFRNNLLLLYKNLPPERLRPVLRARLWLDALASLQMLLSGQWRSALAVWRARRAFARLRPLFAADREENLRLAAASGAPAPELAPRCVLWEYYVLRRRVWSALQGRRTATPTRESAQP